MSTPPDYHAFEIPGAAHFEQNASGLTLLKIETQLASAELYLQGAHLTRFQPAGQSPLLFVSQQSDFAPGQAIRGGVPICFPWFGPRAGHPKAPSHGFARTTIWEITSLRGTAETGVTLELQLASNDATRVLWPHEFLARLTAKFDDAVELTLEIENTGDVPFTYEEALHTYLAVADVRTAAITGLEGASYLDKTDGLQRKQLGSEPFLCTAETDSVFLNHAATCTIDDRAQNRHLTVEKSGSQSTVVWNPWDAKAAAMADFRDDEWPTMLCIETANVAENAISLAPGETHRMTARVSITG